MAQTSRQSTGKLFIRIAQWLLQTVRQHPATFPETMALGSMLMCVSETRPRQLDTCWVRFIEAPTSARVD